MCLESLFFGERKGHLELRSIEKVYFRIGTVLPNDKITGHIIRSWQFTKIFHSITSFCICLFYTLWWTGVRLFFLCFLHVYLFWSDKTKNNGPENMLTFLVQRRYVTLHLILYIIGKHGKWLITFHYGIYLKRFLNSLLNNMKFPC